jgi:hypothetical protein
MGLPEPKLIVSRSEYMSELGKISGKIRRRSKLYSDWGRYASLWRWRRRPEDLERLRAAIRAIWDSIRDERAERAVLARKVVKPYWRIGVAYMFRKETREPPYIFYAEFRKTVYTRTPEKYAILDPKTKEFTKPQPWLEEELREVMFASSLISRRTKRGEIAHGEWIEALMKIKVPPFPDFECSAVDEREVTAPLDTEQYYVRIQKSKAEIYEYGTREVEGWLRTYRGWLREMAAKGILRYPERYARTIRQTRLEDFAAWWQSYKKFKKELKEGQEGG